MSFRARGDSERRVDGTDGNTHFYGFECENLGDGADPWPDVQLEAIERAATALCRVHGWGARSVIGHREWQPGKVDPKGFGMGELRSRITARLKRRPTGGGSSTGGTTASTYTVRPGETLSDIGIKLKINWKPIAQANGIPAPYVIKPCQQLKLPGTGAPSDGGGSYSPPPFPAGLAPNHSSPSARGLQQALKDTGWLDPSVPLSDNYGCRRRKPSPTSTASTACSPPTSPTTRPSAAAAGTCSTDSPTGTEPFAHLHPHPHSTRLYAIAAAALALVAYYVPGLPTELILALSAATLGTGEAVQRIEDAKTTKALTGAGPTSAADSKQVPESDSHRLAHAGALTRRDPTS
nr:LysM peptidoglycan-binding domain-containing protein [Streptomyces rimosus]